MATQKEYNTARKQGKSSKGDLGKRGNSKSKPKTRKVKLDSGGSGGSSLNDQ